MTIYENNDEVRPTGAEGGEVLNAPIRPQRRPTDGDEDADDDDDDDADPGLDTTNLPGDNRPPASARPLQRDTDDGG